MLVDLSPLSPFGLLAATLTPDADSPCPASLQAGSLLPSLSPHLSEFPLLPRAVARTQLSPRSPPLTRLPSKPDHRALSPAVPLLLRVIVNSDLILSIRSRLPAFLTLTSKLRVTPGDPAFCVLCLCTWSALGMIKLERKGTKNSKPCGTKLFVIVSKCITIYLA